MSELKRHEPVAVFVDLRFGELAVADTFLGQDVVDLGDFRVEVKPFLRVVLHELASLSLLGYDKVGVYLGKFSSLKVFEVASCKKLGILRHTVMVGLLAQNILLLEGVALAESLHYI